MLVRDEGQVSEEEKDALYEALMAWRDVWLRRAHRFHPIDEKIDLYKKLLSRHDRCVNDEVCP
jgi:hypothetical protein